MTDKMKMISAMGLALMARELAVQDAPRHYEKPQESKAHKEYRAERRNKKKQQKKNRKANRP